MNKRIIFISFTIIIAISFALSGCVKQPEPVETPQPNIVSDKPEEISFAIWNISQPQSEVSQLIYDYIEENFNIEIKPITMSEDNWRAELDWMISANLLPNVFVHDVTGNKLQYKQLLNTGMISPLPKEIWGQKQRLSEVLSWYEDIYSVNGEMYFIPRTYQTFDQTHGATDVIYYRNDWADTLSTANYSGSVMFTDIVDLLTKFRASDTDGNTIWDTWGITGAGGIDFLWSCFLTPFGVREWVYEDGKWIPGLISMQAKEAIEWAAQLYRDGIIDPEFDTQTDEKAIQKFMSGKAGMVLTSAYYEQIVDFEELWYEYNPDNDIEDCVKAFPSYITPSGVVHNEVKTFQGGTFVSSNTNYSQMYKILDLMNWLFTDQGRNVMTFGQIAAPASNYSEESDAFRISNTELDGFFNLASWNMDKSPDDMTSNSNFISYTQGTIENNVWPWSYGTEIFTDGMVTPEMCVFDIDYIAQEKLLYIIKTTRDFDADWENYINEIYEELNVEQAILEVNEYAGEKNISN